MMSYFLFKVSPSPSSPLEACIDLYKSLLQEALENHEINWGIIDDQYLGLKEPRKSLVGLALSRSFWYAD